MKAVRLAVLLGLGMVARCAALDAQQADSTAALLASLKSPNPQRRLEAYEKIKADEDALRSPEVKAGLLALLDRENQVIQKTLSESDSQPGVAPKHGEEYSEYGELQSTVASIADWQDKRQLCILAESAYDPNSPFAARLALAGGVAVVPCLLKMTHGNISERHESFPVLAQIPATTHNLTSAVRQQIRQAIVAGVQDPTLLVRKAIIEAMGEFGTADMIPILQEVAHSDPSLRRLDNGTTFFDVRDAAARAIQSIQRRTNSR